MIIPSIWGNWNYSNAPEGQAPFEKLVGLCKYGIMAGVGVGVYDSVLISQTTTVLSTLNCVSYWVVPFTAMCGTFASVAYITTKLRGKDGYANYILASFATGGVCYRWLKLGPASYGLTLLLTALACKKKHSDFMGEPFFPTTDAPPDYFRPQYSTYPFDWTLKKDPKGRRSWE